MCQSSWSIIALQWTERSAEALALKVRTYSLPSLRARSIWYACTCQSVPSTAVTSKTIASPSAAIVPLPCSCCSNRQLSGLLVGFSRFFASALGASAAAASRQEVRAMASDAITVGARTRRVMRGLLLGECDLDSTDVNGRSDGN